MGLSMAERRAITKAVAKRYAAATKTEKGKILDELSATTGWTRRHTRRALSNGHQPAATPQPRPVVYDEAVIDSLRRVWIVMGGPCGKRLAPFMDEIVSALERHGEIKIGSEVRTLLVAISPATIDRVLAPDRKRLQVKGRTGTKPGSILKAQIPIRTFAEWDETGPGFFEIDLVSHDGGNPQGEFCQTLDVTDVATGWTEARAVKNKAQRWVFEALIDVRARLPFELLGIDSDNGSEFINDYLFRYCSEQEITFTRSRPYRKNDNCYVEQKNWTVVRQAVGYGRFEGDEALATLNELYDHLRIWVNFFSPQQKLVSKTRKGAKVTRRYDVARTPLQRLLGSGAVDESAATALMDQFRDTNPVALAKAITGVQKRLMAMARSGEGAAPRARAAGHPWKVDAWGPRLRTNEMRQRMRASRTS